MRIMIAGGGTGGHIFPGVAIADALEQLAPGTEVFFMGRRGSIEERVVTGTGRRFAAVPAMGLARGVEARNVAMPFVVAGGYARSLTVLAGSRPAAAIGTGGFISVPPILAARTLGVPVVLQEQNSWPGLATRLLSRLAAEVHVSFDDTAAWLPRARKVVISGNPVRAGLAGLSRDAARRSLGLPDAGRVVFALGGSRGARRINEAVAGAMGEFARTGTAIVAQTGRDDLESVREAAGKAGARAVVEAFFDDVGRAYAASDLVVARAGATTLAEIALVGRPSILVPYPHATEGHQLRNARAFERGGAAVVVEDGALSGRALAEKVLALLDDTPLLASMADGARKLARPDAADRVARATLALARGRGARVGSSRGGHAA
ncbi:MAG: undecaprenyldiphospho-muramoylpentapeptide beta-N-acetylglucosaminyltransferase [Candidatus Eisenbacteria bacterium]|nr:undecaprenyldiphospho-muramoylpentapeptide beta-N-acetylglucosaminyltransferase [Candidatus Eisenbacteria bacterium]